MIKKLKAFLLKVAVEGYASGKFKDWTKEKDGSTTISKEDGDWEMHDNFFGGEPYGGRELVSYKNKPYWIMVYYGQVLKVMNPEEIYPFLREALSIPDEDMPIRGPLYLKNKDFTYKFSYDGTLDQFVANETISIGDQVVYEATFVGGLVDQRKGD
ncbi:MAG: DUF5680 domain-containing protein [Patescibacteria group bacterium]